MLFQCSFLAFAKNTLICVTLSIFLLASADFHHNERSLFCIFRVSRVVGRPLRGLFFRFLLVPIEANQEVHCLSNHFAQHGG